MIAALALVALAQSCPAGQNINADTSGHCCWEGQAWSNLQARCVGTPTCPTGFRAAAEQCVPDCPIGQEINVDTAGHCCWPGQAWSNFRAVCVGVPSCGAGLEARGEVCVTATPTPPVEAPALSAVAAAPPPPAPPAPAPGPERVRRPIPVESTSLSPQPSAPEVSTTPIESDPYENLGRVDLRLLCISDFATPLMVGAQVDMALHFTRGRHARFGMTLGVGFMGHPEPVSFARSVLVLPASFQLGVRLGRSLAEWVFRLGGAAAFVNQYGQMRAMGKMFAGTEIFVPLGTRGSGMTFGADLYFLSGASFVPRFGFVW